MTTIDTIEAIKALANLPNRFIGDVAADTIEGTFILADADIAAWSSEANVTMAPRKLAEAMLTTPRAVY